MSKNLIIEIVMNASNRTLKALAKDARKRAKDSDGDYKLEQELIARTCERELEIRGILV